MADLLELTAYWQELQDRIIKGETQALVSFKAADLAIGGMIDKLAYVRDRLKAEADFCATKEKQWSVVKRSCNNERQRISGAIKLAMQETGRMEAEGEDSRFLLCNSAPKVVITDESLVPDDYFQEKIIKTVDTAAILEDLKAGGTVPGAHLEDIKTLRTYASKKGRKK